MSQIQSSKFQKILPSDILKPYIKYFVISEQENENIYKVLPGDGVVIGFQYKGELKNLQENEESILSKAGITGILNTFKTFKHDGNIGTILVYFTTLGFSAFSNISLHELMNQSISLDNIFQKNKISELQEKLFLSKNDKEKINIVENFLFSELKNQEKDKLILLALDKIYKNKGNIRIKELSKFLYISESAFEKRFRKIVGATPKEFSSIIRINNIIEEIKSGNAENINLLKHGFFDQAHFIKSFKKHTGETPEKFKK